MRIGEVCLLTNDVPRLAAFYKQLLGVENGSNDETHQFIIREETALTVYNDGTVKNNRNQNICLAFTVDNIDSEYEKVLALGAVGPIFFWPFYFASNPLVANSAISTGLSEPVSVLPPGGFSVSCILDIFRKSILGIEKSKKNRYDLLTNRKNDFMIWLGGERMEPSALIDLVQKIRRDQCESQTIEVKAASLGTPKRLYDTLSSFSNQDEGGIIIFGLDEKNGYEVVGVHDAQVLQHEVAEQCKQMEPEVRPLMTVAEYENKYIVAAEIPGADISERPVYYRGAGRIRGSFIRSGEADEPMSEYEIYSLEAFKRRIHDDIRTMDETPGTRYREELIAEYLRKLRQKSRHLRDIASDIEIQELMGIRKDGKPTLAGILNFGVYPQAVFPRLCVTAIVVPGETVGDTGEQGERFLANETINGTLTEMLEDALAFVERNQRIRTVIDENGRRNDCPEFPLKAVREVVLNALIHRDYSSYSEGTPIMLAMYKDRMEVINKGGLYGRVSVSRLGFTHPDTRNPSIAGIMETLDQTENRYSGIPTIRAEMKKANLREPVFQSKNGEFKVILYNSEKNAIQPEETGNLSPKERKLLEFCSIPRTRTEISQHMGSTWTNVKNGYISRLISSGLLRMTKPETPKVRDQQFVAIYRLFQDEQMNGQFVQNEI